MSRLSRRLVTIATAALACALVLTGCNRAAEEPEVQPKVAPPAIATAGVLKVGVDLATPPFAGKDGLETAGIDVDIAAALADKLGVTVEYVDVEPSAAATALADGTADVVFSVPVAGADPTKVTTAGTYISDAAAAFVAVEGTASVEPSLTLDTLPIGAIAAQSESQAYWLLRSEFGSETIQPHASLREALEAVAAGDAPVAAGSALVGAYIARDVPSIRYAGQLAGATPLGVAVEADNAALADAVRAALDELAADGVLESVRRKWVGELPSLKTPSDSGSSAEETATGQ